MAQNHGNKRRYWRRSSVPLSFSSEIRPPTRRMGICVTPHRSSTMRSQDERDVRSTTFAGRRAAQGKSTALRTGGARTSIHKPRLGHVGANRDPGNWVRTRLPTGENRFRTIGPRQEKWSMPSSSDQTRVGRTLTLGGGAEASLEGRDIELSVSPKDLRASPYDLCANRSDRRQSREGPMVRIHFPPAVSLLRT